MLNLHNRITTRDWFFNQYYRIRFWVLRLASFTKDISPLHKPGMTLTFNDDFTEVSWAGNNRKWNVGEHWGTFHKDKPNVYYGAPSIGWRTLGIFTVKHQPRKVKKDGITYNIPFEVSLLSTNKTFRQQYGRWECRMTLPVEKGTFPAFWIWGPTWAPEIDIIEGYGGRTGRGITRQNVSLFWGTPNPTTMRKWAVKIDRYAGIQNRFHEFAMEWTPNRITFITDGIKIFEFTNKKILDEYYNKPGTEPWIILNHSVEPDGNTGKSKHLQPYELSTYSSKFRVDYVRCYQFENL